MKDDEINELEQVPLGMIEAYRRLHPAWAELPRYEIEKIIRDEWRLRRINENRLYKHGDRS